MCESEKLILRFNNAVEQLFKKYPDLVAVDIVRFTTPDGLSVAQSLTGIRNQAQTNVSCP